MKRILLYGLLFIGSVSMAKAQEQEDPAKKEQRIKALYVAYVTQQLSLSETEAQKFWPLHSQFETDIKAVDVNMEELKRQQAVLDIKKRYQDRFVSILGNSRCDRFFKIDGEFRKKLVDEWRRRKHENNGNRRPGFRRGS